MFIFIEANKDVNVGEVIVIKSDNAGGIGAYLIGGERIGVLSGDQPDGCVDYWTVARNLYDNRILGKVAIKCGGAVILYTDSRLLEQKQAFCRVEKEGYGILMCK